MKDFQTSFSVGILAATSCLSSSLPAELAPGRMQPIASQDLVFEEVDGAVAIEAEHFSAQTEFLLTTNREFKRPEATGPSPNVAQGTLPEPFSIPAGYQDPQPTAATGVEIVPVVPVEPLAQPRQPDGDDGTVTETVSGTGGADPGTAIKRDANNTLTSSPTSKPGDALAVPTRKRDQFTIWPDLAPGETTRNVGVALPERAADNPPITRIKDITSPTMEAFVPSIGANGAAVVILPGGGFGYVVPNLEGSEAATFLNAQGITAFVLNYRTKTNDADPAWKRPLQDSQRAIRHLRANAAKWQLDTNKIGILAFSAGGQVGAIHIGTYGDAYAPIDDVDQQSARPDFAMLIYPWRVGDNNTGELIPEIKLDATAPPTFIVHTSDDNSSSLGAVSVYTALKRAGVSAELHVYQNGGHGYGTRHRPGSVIGTWPTRASQWLRIRGLGSQE